MCVSMKPAEFRGTILYAGDGHVDEDDGERRKVRVLGYQNTAKSLEGPNCMILHFPSAVQMTPGNIVDTSGCTKILKDLEQTIDPPIGVAGGGYKSARGLSPDSLHVFDHDVYTIVLANDPRDIPRGIEQVDPDKRPEVSDELVEWYVENLGDHAVALCFFNVEERTEADPMLWWYVPKNWKVMHAPAVDAHDGGPPKTGEYDEVRVGHCVVFGTDDPEAEGGLEPFFSDDLPPEVASLMPKRVVGRKYAGFMSNGDFEIDAEVVGSARVDPHNPGIRRVRTWA